MHGRATENQRLRHVTRAHMQGAGDITMNCVQYVIMFNPVWEALVTTMLEMPEDPLDTAPPGPAPAPPPIIIL